MIDLRPETSYVVNVSGGRTSAFMLRMLLDQHHGLPDNMIVAFMNTGKERNETLDFIHQIETRWNVPIVWLEYTHKPNAKGVLGDPKNTYKIVDYATASRNGEPFEQLIKARKYLPNAVHRICTSELKVGTLNRYMFYAHGINKNKFINFVGIRKDEPKRVIRIIKQDCNILLPLHEAKIVLSDITKYWQKSDFDLPFPYNTTLYTNCDLCFMKGKTKLTEIIRNEPERAEWWNHMEEFVIDHRDTKTGKLNARFHKSHAIKHLIDLSKQPMLFDDDEPAFSCFCGD